MAAEWPELLITASGRVAAVYGNFNRLAEPPAETYVPESSPRVLSVEEARLAAECVEHAIESTHFKTKTDAEDLQARLADFAEVEHG